MKLSLRITLLLLLLTAGVVVCVVRWQAWFGNPPEEPYQVSAVPHNMMLCYGDDAATDRNISWRADTLLRPSYLVLSASTTSLRYDTIPATGRLIESRAGKAAYYHVRLRGLQPAHYTAIAVTDTLQSQPLIFSVSEKKDCLRFVVLGDIQDRGTEWQTQLFHHIYEQHPNVDFIAQVGDLIERPTDQYWQTFFSAIPNGERMPMVAATGNHEYLKGVIKHIDPRWTSVFINPKNGDSRALERTYYIDFPICRFIVLDTDHLFLFSDYTRTMTWLQKALDESGDRQTVVMMHHPVYAAGQGRYNPWMHLFLAHTLKDADIVFAGHDHSYARRIVNSRKSKVEGRKTKVEGHKPSLNIVTTSSEKGYLSRVSKHADRLASGHPMLQEVYINSAECRVTTYLLILDSTLHADSTPHAEEGQHLSLSNSRVQEELYDEVILLSDTIIDHFCGTPEVLDLPNRYKDKDNWKTRLFLRRAEERTIKN